MFHKSEYLKDWERLNNFICPCGDPIMHMNVKEEMYSRIWHVFLLRLYNVISNMLPKW